MNQIYILADQLINTLKVLEMIAKQIPDAEQLKLIRSEIDRIKVVVGGLQHWSKRTQV